MLVELPIHRSAGETFPVRELPHPPSSPSRLLLLKLPTALTEPPDHRPPSPSLAKCLDPAPPSIPAPLLLQTRIAPTPALGRAPIPTLAATALRHASATPPSPVRAIPLGVPADAPSPCHRDCLLGPTRRRGGGSYGRPHSRDPLYQSYWLLVKRYRETGSPISA